MKTRILAAVTALAVALSGFAATPAAALGDREERMLKMLLAFGAAAAIVNQIEKNNDRSRQRYYYDERPRGSSKFYRPSARTIPAHCVFQMSTRDGRRDVVGQRCVERAGLRGRLPEACAFRVRTDEGRATAYGVRCLRDRGYRIEAVRY